MLIKILFWYLNSAILIVNGSLILTSNGYVKGKLVQDDLDYYSYQGIPYAEKPTGPLRFMAPVPQAPWPGVLDGTKEGPVCPQAEGNYKRKQMSEDCLFLNVYVPANKTKLEALSVIVYVHSGEFKSLSGNDDFIYGPQLLLQQDIIVVTMNYRLGALGFLSLDVEEASGNAGIKDVLLALRWVNSNIYRFGGDPKRITLGGNSSGAVTVHYIMLSAKSTGFFHQAILLTGSALGYRFHSRYPKDNAIALGLELGLETCDTYELLKELKEVDAFDIVKAQENMGINNTRNGIRPFAPFVPSTEINCTSAVITKKPIDIIKAGIPQNVPILAGFNSREGIKMLPVIEKDHTLVDHLNEDFELAIPSDIEYPYASCESLKLASKISEFYFNNANVTNSTLENFVEFTGDTQFSYSIDSWINLHKKRNDSKVLYYYVFNFDGDLNWFKLKNNIKYPGAAHSDELGYLFKTQATTPILQKLDSRSERMLHIMVTTVSNFIKYGNPTPEGYEDIKWPEFDTQQRYMVLSDKPFTTHGTPMRDNLLFWYAEYDKYFNYLKNGGLLAKKIVP